MDAFDGSMERKTVRTTSRCGRKSLQRGLIHTSRTFPKRPRRPITRVFSTHLAKRKERRPKDTPPSHTSSVGSSCCCRADDRQTDRSDRNSIANLGQAVCRKTFARHFHTSTRVAGRWPSQNDRSNQTNQR